MDDKEYISWTNADGSISHATRDGNFIKAPQWMLDKEKVKPVYPTRKQAVDALQSLRAKYCKFIEIPLEDLPE